MKRLMGLSAIMLALQVSAPRALAQSLPPPLPALSAQQSEDLAQRIDVYRRDTDARVARGEITADEADRLVRWREWQLAQQAAGVAPPAAAVHDAPPPDYYGAPPPDYYIVEPPAYYVPYRYAAPYYWGPRPYYWGPAVCAGGFGRHFGGRICF